MGMPATGKQISVEAVDIGSIMGWATARALAVLVVPVRYRHAPVTPDPPARRPGPPADTAWLPRSCSYGCMAGAAMQLGPGTGGAAVTGAIPVSRAPLHRARTPNGTELQQHETRHPRLPRAPACPAGQEDYM